MEEYFWKDGRAVPLYDEDSWRELKRVATISPPLVVVNDNGIDEDWRLSSGIISIHCKLYTVYNDAFVFVLCTCNTGTPLQLIHLCYCNNRRRRGMVQL